jgi:hypothetical protein
MLWSGMQVTGQKVKYACTDMLFSNEFYVSSHASGTHGIPLNRHITEENGACVVLSRLLRTRPIFDDVLLTLDET